MANSTDPDQMSHSVTSDLGQHSLLSVPLHKANIAVHVTADIFLIVLQHHLKTINKFFSIFI